MPCHGTTLLQVWRSATFLVLSPPLPPQKIDMDEVSNFCTGDICQLRLDAATTPGGVPSVAQLRDDPPWVRAVGWGMRHALVGLGVLGFGHGGRYGRPGERTGMLAPAVLA